MTDSELVHLVRSADPSGLSFVYEKYRKEFISWIRKFSRCNEEEAREFYQAAVLILYENIMNDKLKELQSSLKTYLFGIGKNLALQNHRNNLRLKRTKAEYMLEQHVQNSDENLLKEEVSLDVVSRCFRQLGDPCHSLLELFYFYQKKMEEIASTLGYKNPETAKNQKYKCMERLRKLVNDEQTTERNVVGLN